MSAKTGADRPRPRWWSKITRDVVLFSAGLLGFAHEVLANGPERYGLLVLLAGMMGLPSVLRFDEMRRRDD